MRKKRAKLITPTAQPDTYLNGGSQEPATTVVSISDLNRAPASRARLAVDWSVVDQYEEAMKRGAIFPAIIVYSDGESFFLADGLHRVVASQRVTGDKISAEVRPGDGRDAYLFAISANLDHGKQATQADKMANAKAMIADDEWFAWADREIARRCGVSATTVGKLRKQRTAAEGGEVPTERKYRNRHGGVSSMDTGGQRQAALKRSQAMKSEREDREAAKAAQRPTEAQEAAQEAAQPAADDEIASFVDALLPDRTSHSELVTAVAEFASNTQEDALAWLSNLAANDFELADVAARLNRMHDWSADLEDWRSAAIDAQVNGATREKSERAVSIWTGLPFSEAKAREQLLETAMLMNHVKQIPEFNEAAEAAQAALHGLLDQIKEVSHQ